MFVTNQTGSIHPFNHFPNALYPVLGQRGLQPMPTTTGREAGHTLDMPPVHHRGDRTLIFAKHSFDWSYNMASFRK